MALNWQFRIEKRAILNHAIRIVLSVAFPWTRSVAIQISISESIISAILEHTVIRLNIVLLAVDFVAIPGLRFLNHVIRDAVHQGLASRKGRSLLGVADRGQHVWLEGHHCNELVWLCREDAVQFKSGLRGSLKMAPRSWTPRSLCTGNLSNELRYSRE